MRDERKRDLIPRPLRKADEFIVSEDGTSLSLTEEQAKINADLLGGPTDGVAVLHFCPGPEQAAESIRVPFHYEPAQG